MYVSDNLIFLQLQKTACTHIERILKSYFPGEQVGKHGPLTFDPGDRRIVGSIRNPFDWYVSLWSYGCLKRGYIQSVLTAGRTELVGRLLRERGRQPGKWPEMVHFLGRALRHETSVYRAFYTDPDDPALFQGWLRQILTGPRRPYLEDDYPLYPIDGHIGLFSYRFLRLFTDVTAWKARHPHLADMEALRDFHARHSICSTFIRNERLEQDLSALLRDLGVAVTAEDLVRDKVNASKHRPYTEYYDDETADLVRTRDGLICDLFGYDLHGTGND